MNTNLNVYTVFWFSQSVSQLGSAMTGFALILWIYGQNHSAMEVSLMTFFNYVPYVIVSLFAGGFVDRHHKKRIMQISDSLAAACSAVVLVCVTRGLLAVWVIYIVNAVIGFMNAFQSPAMAVAVGKLVPKEKLANVSGMNSFSSNLIAVLTPVLAAFLFAAGGLKLILLIDFASFLFAFSVLSFIRIPEEIEKEARERSAFSGVLEGFRYLRGEKGILMIMVTMALLNFFSRLTYENILSPMILSRSGNSGMALGVVNAVMGMGGIAGGMIVSAGKGSKDSVRMIYVSAAISFLGGDLLMGLGRSVPLWSLAGIAASLPIPFIMAGQNVILYSRVPERMLGRVFAVRNAVQYSTIPIGILAGGFLADHVFEPFMRSDAFLADALKLLVGQGAGSGMALMFLCTGICGFCISCLSYRSKEIQNLR